MTKLSDTQALILSAAAQRPELIALPLPESLRGGAAAKVISAMLTKGLLEEVDADVRKGEPMWRKTACVGGHLWKSELSSFLTLIVPNRHYPPMTILATCPNNFVRASSNSRVRSPKYPHP